MVVIKGLMNIVIKRLIFSGGHSKENMYKELTKSNCYMYLLKEIDYDWEGFVIVSMYMYILQYCIYLST